MARDRQRAKQRRAKRQPGPGGSRASRDLRRDEAAEADGLDRDEVAGNEPLSTDPARSDEVVDTPLGQGTAAPDPLLHSSAGLDEARMAEVGPIYADELGDEDDDFERAPDEAEGDAPIRRSGVATEHAPDRRRRGRVLTFLGHCVDELRRVQWPDRRHVGQATAVVLGFVVLAGGYLGLLDALWRPLVEAII
jgi:preprotein translocase SecE subunit